MLQSLYVKNLALIDELNVDFTEGLNIMTGETGAGKSIILGSINFCLGDKIPKEMIKEDVPYSMAELTFIVESDFERKSLEALDIFPEDDQVVINRKIVGGRSTTKINSETVTVSVLKKVADVLINVHGQNESHILQDTKRHLAILDDYGTKELLSLKEKMRETYAVYKVSKQAYNSLNVDDKERERELSFLEFEIEEISNAKLIDNEDEALEEEYRKLKNWQKIYDGLNKAYTMTGGENDSAANNISYALRELSSITEYDESLNSYYSMLSDVENLLSDFNRDISSYLSDGDFDVERFNEIEHRLDLINSLKAKYGDSISTIKSVLVEKEERLELLNNFKERKEEAKKVLDKAFGDMKIVAEDLHLKREKVAKKFEKEIEKALLELNFSNAEFKVMFSENKSYNEDGSDFVEFYISTNQGEQIRPLNKIASGGELSRIMLAIKTLQANKDETHTMIFDEIDAGISGRTAQKVSESLHLLSKNHQIICITHLPQIAAMEDSHYLIEKKIIDGHSKTTIEKLDDNNSIMELARMLGGTIVSDAVINNAKELKEMALKYKTRG